MALADNLGGTAATANLPDGANTTTIDSKTNFFAPVPHDDTAFAECTPLHRGRTASPAATASSGATDIEIIARAQDEGRLLLTEHKDFGELVFRQAMLAPGVVLLRIDPPKHSLKWSRLHAAIARFGESFFGRYTVIEEMRFRSRHCSAETPNNYHLA